MVLCLDPRPEKKKAPNGTGTVVRQVVVPIGEGSSSGKLVEPGVCPAEEELA